MDSSFFKGYRKTAVLPSEILVSVLIPFSSKVRLMESSKTNLSLRHYLFCSLSHALTPVDNLSVCLSPWMSLSRTVTCLGKGWM